MEPPDILEVVTPVVDAFDALGIPYHLAGSVASSIFGIARSTVDADIVADIAPHHARPLAKRLESEYYISEDMIRDAVRHRSSFNLIHLKTMFKVDVFLPKNRPVDQEAATRIYQEVLADDPDARVFNVASPEDTILSKLEWYRRGGETSDRQWTDILGVLKVQGPTLDLAYLRRWAPEIGVADLLERAFADAGLDEPPTAPMP